MDNFSLLLTIPTDFMNKKQLLLRIYLRRMREAISLFIANDKHINDYYNFSNFFLKNKINDDGIKESIMINIVNELKELNYFLGYVFNKTGLIISEDDGSLNSNVWRSNLTFERLT